MKQIFEVLLCFYCSYANLYKYDLHIVALKELQVVC